MIKYVVFDLDQTLIDTSCVERDRKNRDWRTVYSKIPEMKIYEGIRELLDFLKHNNITFAIVTKSPKVYCEKVVNFFKIYPIFIIGYHDVSKRKPNPEALLLALKLFNHNNPNEVMHIGDDVDDIIASKLACFVNVAAGWGAINTNELAQKRPDYLVDKPQEIIEIIRKLN